MAPNLTVAELDYVQQLLERGKSPIEIHHSLCRMRGRRKVQPPHLTNLRKVLKGLTYKRSAVETRGRKSKLSRRMVLRMNDTRKRLLKKRCGMTEVRWTDVIKAAPAACRHCCYWLAAGCWLPAIGSRSSSGPCRCRRCFWGFTGFGRHGCPMQLFPCWRTSIRDAAAEAERRAVFGRQLLEALRGAFSTI